MTHQHVSRTNQQSKSDTPLVSGILQRAAVRNVPENEVEPTEEVEATTFKESRFHHNFSQVPVSTGEMPRSQPKLKIAAMGDLMSQAKGKFSKNTSLSSEVQRPNNTGLPDTLKAGVEALSGISMDHVKVHYNSSKPAQLSALAYTQGSEIHVGPGQEQHLPHEAWHVVQQAQGRVLPTMQMAGVAVNEDGGLESEADVMGARASGRGAAEGGVTQRASEGASVGLDEKVRLNLLNAATSADLRPETASVQQRIHTFQRKCEQCEDEKTVQRMKAPGAVVQMVPCQETDHDTSLEHKAIENDYKANVSAALKEYEIPEGSLRKHPNGTHKTGYADLVVGKHIYDIKRHDESPPLAQLDQYLLKANQHCGGGFSKGSELVNRTITLDDESTINYWKDLTPGVISYRKFPAPLKGVAPISSFFSGASSSPFTSVSAKSMPLTSFGAMSMGGGGGEMGLRAMPAPAMLPVSGMGGAASGFASGTGGTYSDRLFFAPPFEASVVSAPAPKPLAEYSRFEIIVALAGDTINEDEVKQWILAQHDIDREDRDSELADILRAAARRR